jgi:hypothetical protein
MATDGTIEKLKQREKRQEFKKISNLTADKAAKYIETGKL